MARLKEEKAITYNRTDVGGLLGKERETEKWAFVLVGLKKKKKAVNGSHLL